MQTPYLLSASQFDRFQLPYNEGSNPPYKGANLTYANRFQAAVRAIMLELPTSAQPRSAVYSSACYKHCTSTLAYGSFWGIKVNGVSLKDFLAAWYYGSTNLSDWTSANAGTGALPAGMSPQHIESCNGYGCGSCHKKLVAPEPPLPPAYAQSLLAGAPPLKIVVAPMPGQRRSARTLVREALLLVVVIGIGFALATRLRSSPRARAPTGSVEMPALGEESPLLGAKRS